MADFHQRKFNVSLKIDFIFQFHTYFSARFAFYFLVSYTYSIATFKNLLNMAVLEERLSKADI